MKRLFKNAKIASLDTQNNFYNAIGVDNEKIVFLGTNDEAKNIEKDYDECIDLKGNLLLPGFNDSHMHLLNYGYTKTKLDLIPFESIEEIIEGSKNFLSSRKDHKNQWLLGRGWNQDKLKEKRFPTRNDLDSISREVPIIFTRACGHISVCNSKALEQVDLEKAPHLKDYVDEEQGLFQEDALNLLYKVVPSPSIEDIQNMILNSCEDLVAMGITSVQTDDLCCMPDQDYTKVLTAYNTLNKEDRLPVKIYQQCLFFNEASFKPFVEEGHRTGQGNEFFKIGPLKLLLDGSLGARTAYLLAPYEDAKDTKGIPCYKQKELDKLVDYALKHNFQLAAHGIGDGAMDMFIKSLNNSHYHEANNDNRHGIVHAQITSHQLIDDMAELNLLAYIQPIFLDYDLHIVESRVGKRSKETYAFKTMMNKGLTICNGTDAPVVDINPLENIYSAVLRKDLKGTPEKGFLPEERLTLTEALKAYTINGAYSSFEETVKGTLELGKRGDFIVLNQDLFEIDPHDIKTTQVLMTVINGKTVYQK